VISKADFNENNWGQLLENSTIVETRLLMSTYINRVSSYSISGYEYDFVCEKADIEYEAQKPHFQTKNKGDLAPKRTWRPTNPSSAVGGINR